jgi:hypothetical protein
MMSKRLKTLWSFPMLLAMSGCVGGLTAAPATVSDYCLIAKPIGYDTTHDTPATVKAVETHNSQWVCVCEHDCPQPPSR